PPLTHNILDDQPLLTVSSMNGKAAALREGLGIATLPSSFANKAIADGELAVIGDDPVYELEMVVAWNRTRMGKAKSWCIQHLESLWKKQNS
ncbi:LysR substrate-binding domain-containing protein, partial [Photobacterium sanctipauli]